MSAAALLLALAAVARPARAQGCMHIRYTFQPDCYRPAGSGACVQTVERLDLGPQIAVWLESANRTQFVDTLMVTNMTAARGIGNRPGLWNFLSSPFFPYGKRRMVLPIWAHARGKLYDSVVMQDDKEDWLGFHEGHSSSEPYFCRPVMPSEIDVDAISCPTRFSSAKGKLDPSVPSYYPPRNDLTVFTNNDCDKVGSQLPSCTVSAQSYATLNDLDAVAAATPVYGAAYSNTWVIPSALPAGDYALYVEVNKEFDNNAAHMHPSVKDGNLPGYGLTNNFGQPSVVYRVPLHIDLAAGTASSATTSVIEGYSDWTGVDGGIIPRDATISTTDAGSGEARLLLIATAAGTGRVHASIESCGTTGCDPTTMNCCDPTKQVCPPLACNPLPPAPERVMDFAPAQDGLTAMAATLEFKHAQANGAAVASYEVRYREGQSMTDDEFLQAIRAPLVPPGTPGSLATFTLSGLKPATQYVVGVRAADACGQTSPVVVLAFPTPVRKFKQVEGCFVATAAWGSPVAGSVPALRAMRDRLRAGNAVGAVATDLYYRSGPAAADVIRRDPAARALARRLLAPIGALAQGILAL
jgi:hypothetical protein